jgi:hypothetical protein
MDITAVPYTSADLYRPQSEGRSLHDDASWFYCHVMGLSTPLVEIPSLEDIGKAIATVIQSDPCSRQLIVDLKGTVALALWPELDGVPPQSKEGMLWNAAKHYNFDCVQNVVEATKKTLDQHSDEKEEGNEETNQLGMGKKGRKKGAKK